MVVLLALQNHQGLARALPAVVEGCLEVPTLRPPAQADSEDLGKLPPLQHLALEEEIQEVLCLEAIKLLALVELQALQHLVGALRLVGSVAQLVVLLEHQHLLLYLEEQENVRVREASRSKLMLKRNQIAPPTNKTPSKA